MTYHSHPESANAKPRGRYSRAQISLFPATLHPPFAPKARTWGYLSWVAASSDERRAIARLIHRVGFGPKAGEFESALAAGFDATASQMLSAPKPSYGDLKAQLGIFDLGPRPRPNTAELLTYGDNKRRQTLMMTLWWLDQMSIQERPIHERMTWFWHGHWATSLAKVDDPLPMFDHVEKLRAHALGSFLAMSKSMVMDAALIFWLDGQRNTATAPNENLARELLELFMLGVNRYQESDIREISKVLTGYKVQIRSGTVTRNLRQAYQGHVNIFGSSQSLDSISLVEYLAKRSDCQRFIPERLWFRFISSSVSLPSRSPIEESFANREVLPAMRSLISSSAFSDPVNSQVKSPVDWFISALRALDLQPSKLPNPNYAINTLRSLGQVPYQPPNVGGWPADEAWLSAAASQTRIQTAQYLTKLGDLTPVSSAPQNRRIEALANWLGVWKWSDRTSIALRGAIRDPQRLAMLGICSPEYVVSA